MNRLILVNDEDHIIGTYPKLKTHEQGLLHRAFSIVILNKRDNRILLQKRALTKYHSRGLWSNSCCSHFSLGHLEEESLHIRLKEEIGVEAKRFTFCGKLRYQVKLEELSEHEIDYIYLARAENDFEINREEVEECKYMSLQEILNAIKDRPEQFTFWFKLMMRGEYLKKIQSLIEKGI